MPLSFIFDLVIVLCAGTILYLVARALPKISDENNGKPVLKTSKTLVYLEKADEKFKKSREKLLRRIRVIILKFDNYLSGRLSKFKRNEDKNGGFRLSLDKEPSSRPEIMEKNTEGEDVEKGEDTL